MNSTAHLIAGFAVAIAISLLLAPVGWGAPLSVDLVVVAGLGALLPDLDHRQTKIFRFTLALLFVAGVMLAWPIAPSLTHSTDLFLNAGIAVAVGAVAAVAFFVLKPRHRGPTHSLAAAIAFAAIVLALTLNWGLGIAAFVAYASHLALDRL
ncbi:metal-dependent hydrolase [Candidatus Micrarchaeota archaeon]|nr:metal-dependent hydrolase [Candidatus Micrarchaeota archaeon]